MGAIPTPGSGSASSITTAGGDEIKTNTAQTPDTLTIGVAAASRSLLLIEDADDAFDFAHAQQINPTLFVHSANQHTAEWVSIHHKGTGDSGYITSGATGLALTVGTENVQLNLPSQFIVSANHQIGFNSTNDNAAATALDTAFARNAAGVIRATAGGAQIRGFLGGGAAVASAAALPLPTGRVFHVTGTTTVTSITSTDFESGAVITLIFDGILTFTDGSNLVLAGNFVTTANDTITLVYDGTSWFETSRSVN